VVLDSCTQILAGSQYKIATAVNGTVGLRLVEEFKPDVVFVDLKMPGISGFEVLARIHEVDPTIVTIVITGYATVDSAVEAMKKWAYDFLPKPFTPDELRLITQRGLEKRKLILETIALRREKEMLREHFAAIVSHELKSPLSAVQQNLFDLGEELANKLTEDQKRRFGRIQSRISDLVKLIHTWLRMISTDIENIRENLIPITVPPIISKAIESVQVHAARKDIEIITSQTEISCLICGEEVTLVEALVNILSNAIKFSRIGSKVLVTVEEIEDEVLISVKDTGVGIAREDLPLIFNDFYTGRPPSDGERGSGLGLAITRRIIEAHGGAVSVESELGKGSTFFIHLPVLRVDNTSNPMPNIESGKIINVQGGTDGFP